MHAIFLSLSATSITDLCNSTSVQSSINLIHVYAEGDNTHELYRCLPALKALILFVNERL